MEAETQVEGDVHEGVDRLVAEIDRAVGLIERLRRDNAELTQQRQALQSEVTRLEEGLVTLRSDRDRLQQIYDDNAVLIHNKSEIQSKIEVMLSRLDALNQEETNTDN
ncbi:MAG: putative nuclease with TOPRIM domain [Candidatus Latescibacterota bacterium]|jgi:predicted nuclease with TOPRIM domain